MREVMIFSAEFDPDEEPIPFQLEITNKRTKAVRVERFVAMGDPGIGGDIAAATLSQFDHTTGKRIIDLNGLRKFFARVLPDEDYARLDALIEDKTVSVPMDMLGKVFNRLVSIYAGGDEEGGARPTESSPVSSNGQPATGPTLTGQPS